MSREWRDRVLHDYARELDEWWAEVSRSPVQDPDEVDAIARANFLRAIRHYDPDAHLSEELLVQLRGEIAAGALNFDLGLKLLKPIQDGVDASADGDVRLELADILPGSTVLVVRPVAGPPENEGALSPADTSAADQGAREWLRLIATAEGEGDVRPWATAFTALDKLVQVLEVFSLNVGFAWLAPGGDLRRAGLTERGRTYVRRLSEGSTVDNERTIGGRVTELKVSGHVVVKAGPQRGATSYDVHFDDADELIALNLHLGQHVWFVVSEATTTDRVQRVLGTTYRFVRLLAANDQLSE